MGAQGGLGSEPLEPLTTAQWGDLACTMWHPRVLSLAPSLCLPRLWGMLKPRHVTAWLNEQETWNDTTKGIAVRSLKRGFNWAVAEGIIDHNPIAALKRPPSLPRETIIAPHHWREILDVVPDQEFRDFLIVLKNTGARPGEIRQMEARHVHGDVVIFPKVSSKGKRYNRVIYPNKEAKAIIDRLARRHPEGPLFRNTRGEPWTANAVACRFKRLTKKLGFKSFAYAFRHTFATDGLINGVDSTAMANLLGHQDLGMVARNYSHLVQNQGFLLNEAERATGGEDPA